MKKLYIIGAGGFGREVAWLVERINEENPTWSFQGFIDDDKEKWNTYENDYKVCGSCDYLMQIAEKEECYAVCAIGSAKNRKCVIGKMNGSKIKYATLVDPSVISSKHVEIGEGSIICAGTILTVDIKIGNHVIVNLDCTIGHDAIIEDYVTIYPSVNVSGMTQVNECVELGTGTQIIQGRKIGAKCIIGAGSVVVKDIGKSGTYVGIPAKRIK